MDPFTISTVVVKVTAICLSAAKTLYDVRSKMGVLWLLESSLGLFSYADAPITLVTLCSETSVISASLSYLQTIVCQKQEFVQTLESRPELAHALDAALVGCMVLFSCLEKEMGSITASNNKAGALSWKKKTRLVWNHEKLQQLLDGLRGQQLAINLLIQLVQVKFLGEIRQLLSQNRPVMTESIRNMKTLKEANPEINVPDSIYDGEDRMSIYSAELSVAGASALEFEFDDVIVNSKVYRRVLASAMVRAGDNADYGMRTVEGDLIDHSDSRTIQAAAENVIDRDLQNLAFSEEASPTVETAEPSGIMTTDDSRAAIANIRRKQIAPADSRITNLVGKITKFGSTVLSQQNDDGVDHTAFIAERKDKRRTNLAKIGSYNLGNTIGQGETSGSKVKLGWRENSEVQVAIKLTRKRPRNLEAQLDKIYREITLLRKLSHPNIVRFREVVESEKYIGSVVDYASGGELLDYVSAHQYLEDQPSRRLFVQIISGVRYLHSKGIAHRNINLHNLLLNRNRNVIISGFGSAKTFEADKKLHKKMKTNCLI